MVTARLSLPDAKEKGWLLDGFPRSYAQAQSLEERKIRPDIYIVLDVCRPLHIHNLCFLIAPVLYSTLFVRRICSLHIARIGPLVSIMNFRTSQREFFERGTNPKFHHSLEMGRQFMNMEVDNCLCSWISSIG